HPDAHRGAHFPHQKVTPVRFAPEVPDELAEAVLWYEARKKGLGSELLDEVQATLPIIGTRPRSFPRLQDIDATLEIRRALLARAGSARRPGPSSACSAKGSSSAATACAWVHGAGIGLGFGPKMARTWTQRDGVVPTRDGMGAASASCDPTI